MRLQPHGSGGEVTAGHVGWCPRFRTIAPKFSKKNQPLLPDSRGRDPDQNNGRRCDRASRPPLRAFGRRGGAPLGQNQGQDRLPRLAPAKAGGGKVEVEAPPGVCALRCRGDPAALGSGIAGRPARSVGNEPAADHPRIRSGDLGPRIRPHGSVCPVVTFPLRKGSGASRPIANCRV